MPSSKPAALRPLALFLPDGTLDRAALATERGRRAWLFYTGEKEPYFREYLLVRCRADPAFFVDQLVFGYDPRRLKSLPFVLWPRQREYLEALHRAATTGEELVVEKSRDVGVTYLTCAYAVWRWLFSPGFKTTFCANKLMLVDSRGNPDSIFEKLRLIVRLMPVWLRPDGFSWELHDNIAKLTNPENGNVITGEGGDNAGRGGRAQPMNARILTPTGWSTMAEIAAGDLVIGSSGQPTKVLSVHPQGVKPVFRVGFNDGSFTECCDDHLWQVTDRRCRKVIACHGNRTWGRRFEVLPLRDIRHRLVVARRDDQLEFQYRVPIVGPVQYVRVELPLHPYFLGALIGNGALSQIAKIPVGFSTGDAEMIETLTALLPPGFVIRDMGRYTFTIVVEDGGRVGPGRRNAVKAPLFALGLAGTKSGTKFIPELYKRSSPEERLELLRGLLDTDGWVGRRQRVTASNKVCFSTISRRLAGDVIEVVRSLGGIATLTRRDGAARVFPDGILRECNESFQVTMAMPSGMNPYKISRKADLHRERTKYLPGRSMISVEPIGEMETRCITVEAPDGLYVTDDFIVTHNSTLYVIDEAAHVERADSVNTATSANSFCRVWASSVNGVGNFFYRHRHSGEVPVFTFGWRSDPRKNDDWAAREKARIGPVAFAQEHDLDYGASLEGVCIPKAWVDAARELRRRLGNQVRHVRPVAGMDVGAGKAESVVVLRSGPLVSDPLVRRDPDSVDTAWWAIEACQQAGASRLCYDSVGVGHGLGGIFARAETPDLAIAGVNVGDPPSDMIWPDERTSKDKFANLKAELWWRAREAFERSHALLRHLDGDPEGVDHPVEDVLLMPEDEEMGRQLATPKWLRTERGKIIIESKESLARRGVKSPDRAEAFILSLFEGPATSFYIA